MVFELVVTKDGSHTLYAPEFNAHYHSLHGAIQESLHVFIRSGLHFIAGNKQDISILETGFGTGLNAFLTAIEAEKLNLNVQYTGIDAFPVDREIVQQLNYPDILGERPLFSSLHSLKWGAPGQITNNFSLHKIHSKFNIFRSGQKYDLLYFDAFAPNSQPELWSMEFLEHFGKFLNSRGAMVTYCAKGSVKRALKNLGFDVESLPGPPGKREITRVIRR